ncbi:hypothetical protein [Streptomyces sp. NPDC094468]|uniref:hypothetical protein n=1 Tax=Streptomyces sp. NPDC094468 TaxID=3366066 RepID=UPI003830D846
MTAPMPPWQPDQFEDRCETCAAPPGELCRPWCDTGYTPDDYRADAERAGGRRPSIPGREVPPPEDPPHRPYRRPKE